MRTHLIAGLALCLAGPAALAQSAYDPLDTRVFRNGFWLGGGASWSSLDIDDSTFDDDSLGYNVGVGYQFANYFGISGRWLDLGGFDDASQDADLDGYRVGLSAGVPFSGRVAGLFSAGYYDFDTDTEPASVAADDGEDGLYLTAGIASQVGRVVVEPQLVWYDAENADLWAAELNFYWKIEAGN